jgi:predicted dehydrogenase
MNQREIELMRYALEKAQEKDVRLLLENEPACVVSDFDDYVGTLKYFQKEGLLAWVDIANFYEIGRRVNKKMLEKLSPFIEYIHIKDPIGMREHSYVPVGDGYINYKRIFSDLVDVLKKPIFFSIETHVKTKKAEASRKSLAYIRSIISTPRKKYAIIGAGRVSQKHTIACRHGEKSELRGVFDVKANLMKTLAVQYDCEIYSSLEELLSDSCIDVVNICTPNNSHLNIAQKVVDSGKIALCEKPFSINPEKLKKYAANPRFNRNTYVVFQKRFTPAAEQFLRLIKNGSLGEIISFSIRINWWRDLDYFSDWHGCEKISGGPLFMQAIHAIDLLREATDLDVVSASGYSHRSRGNLLTDDIVSTVVRLKNGAVGQIEVNLAAFKKNIEESLFIVGTAGSIKLGGVGLSEDNHTQTIATGFLPQKYFDTNKQDYFGEGHTRLIQTLSNNLLNVPDEKASLLVHPRDIINIIRFTRSVYNVLTRI